MQPLRMFELPDQVGFGRGGHRVTRAGDFAGDPHIIITAPLEAVRKN
jgi:hypothetical protein